MIKKTYIDVNGVQLHARVAGSGPPVMLLHASPLSSAFMLGHIDRLQKQFQVIAVDTPGYGNSDPLPAAPASLNDYAGHLLAAAETFGLGSFRLYGTATGAQIALAMAKHAPERITKLVLDNCAHFDESIRNKWIKSYFPDLTPQADGSHWHTAWDIATAQFQYFPWHIQSALTALNRPPPPPEMITQMALGFISSTPAYHTAYRLAFEAEDIASFMSLAVPTTLIDWQGSIVRPFVQTLIDKGLPDIVQVITCGPHPADRFEAIAKSLA